VIHLYKNPEEIGRMVEEFVKEALVTSPPYWVNNAEYRQILRQKVAVRVLRILRERGELQGAVSAE